ncbi:MAG: Helix-turn-helix domain protein [Syntrophorhabdaceae bacterium PtaU1.Bin034]|nr:MAG: Helix-turn-helix domain protein [Syntrophorhabdaceae bacterium PtaU1.Bin034]
MATAERWVGVDDVAAHLGVAKDSVYRWIEERGLPAHRVGRLFRFKLSEIDDWVRTGKESVRASNPTKKPPSSQSAPKAPSGKKEGNE